MTPRMRTTKIRRGAPRRGEPSARERLIETAIELFYQEGIRAIGIDTLVAHSGLSKSETTTRHGGSPRQQIEALFEGIAEQIANPRFRGCPFINLATEFPDRQHPGTVIARTNKMEVRSRLRLLARALNARDPRRLSDQLALLIDGAYGHALTLGAAGFRRELIEMATLLIDAQVGQQNREA
jgi:hypothetical protein